MMNSTSHRPFRGTKRPRLLFVGEHVPDENGSGLEKRTLSFLCAYTKIATVDLLILRHLNRSQRSRLLSVKNLFTHIAARPRLFVKIALKLPFSGIQHRLESADAVHVVKLLDFIDTIRQDRIFWDIDEVPPRFKENWNAIKNMCQIPLKNKDISRN